MCDTVKPCQRVFEFGYFDCTDAKAFVDLRSETKIIFDLWYFDCTDAEAPVNLQNENRKYWSSGISIARMQRLS